MSALADAQRVMWFQRGLPASLDPKVSTHLASAAWRVFAPAFGLSIYEQEAVSMALIARDMERRGFRRDCGDGTWAWVEEAGKQS